MNTPTEYFGPHAKRWTHPRTGVTYSVKPRDYHQLVAEEKEKIEAAAVESSPIPAVMAAHYDAIVYGATRGGIKYPTPEESVADAGLPRYLSMAGDDSVCLIRPVEQPAPGEPAARHFRRRPSARNIARLALVYIIAVIGVISVAGVVF